MVEFKDLDLALPQEELRQITIANGKTLQVKSHLSLKEKTDFLNFVTNVAIDNNTGVFDPLRVEVAFGVAICMWYGNIRFSDDDIKGMDNLYDILDSNGIIDDIIQVMEAEEYDFMYTLVEETTKNIARYNTSAAGIIQAMSNSADGLDKQISDIVSKLQSRENLELLDAIKDQMQVKKD